MRSSKAIHWLSASAAVLLFGLAFGCADQPDPTETVRPRLTPGQIHTLGLEYVRLALLNHRGLDKETVIPVIREAVNRFAGEHDMAPVSEEQWRMALGVVRGRDGMVRTQGESPFSPRVQYYGDQIDALGQTETDLQSYLSSLSAIEASAYDELSGPDSLAVWTMADLARHSANYWSANYSAWENTCAANPDVCENWDGGAFPPPSRIEPMGISWRGWKVLVSDVSAGVVACVLSACNAVAVPVATFAASALAFVLTA